MDWDSFKRIAAWYSKLFLGEPFRLYERLSKEKQIINCKIEKPPIFVLGHWRSGTSFLHSLLSCDPRRGFLRKYESVFPESFLSSENLLKPLVKRIIDPSKLKRNVSKISGRWEWEAPGEPDIAMITSFSPYSPHWGHAFPAESFDYYMDKYACFDTATKEEERRWKEAYRYLMNKISIKNEHRQLVIKNPADTGRIKQLLELYPDARFVYIHRSPYDVFYSNLKMWNVIIDNLSFQKITQEEIISNIFSAYSKLLGKYLEHRSLIPESNLIEIYFEDLAKAPLSILEQIYQTLALEGFEDVKPLFRRFLDSQKNHTPSRYRYSAAISERIEWEWKFSLEEWPYERPRQGADAASQKTPREQAHSAAQGQAARAQAATSSS